jgi:hypothetical protein
MNQSNELVTVYTAMGRLEAEVVRGRLQAENIPAMLAYESVGQTFGIIVDGLGQVLVKVPRVFADEARAILSETP